MSVIKYHDALIVSPTFVASDASPETIEKTLAPWEAIAVFGHGAYISFSSHDTLEELQAAYPPTSFARLAQIKKQYDPENIFHRNYNIPPAS